LLQKKDSGLEAEIMHFYEKMEAYLDIGDQFNKRLISKHNEKFQFLESFFSRLRQVWLSSLSVIQSIKSKIELLELDISN
jgi:hypothetical protein